MKTAQPGCFHLCSQASDLRHLRPGIERRSHVARSKARTTGEPRPAALKNEVIHCDSGTIPVVTP
jgi:hypothetical protein